MKVKWSKIRNSDIIRNTNDRVINLFLLNKGEEETESSKYEHILVRFLKSYSTNIIIKIRNNKNIKNIKINNGDIIYDYAKIFEGTKQSIINIFEDKKIKYHSLDTIFKYNNFLLLRMINYRDLCHLNGMIIELAVCLKNDISIATSLDSDYDKIINSSSFRRLQDKTQVYPLVSGDYSRTRLTHSIEVSGTSRMISSCIINNKSNSCFIKHFNLMRIKIILESGCLVHDVGNPPFGHYGETIIRNYFIDNWNELKCNINNKKSSIKSYIKKNDQLYFDFSHFDGNAQSLRILSKLQYYKNKSTLELPLSVLSSIIKYPFNSIVSNRAKKDKIGYFYSEQNDVIKRMKLMNLFIDNYRNPYSILIEASDDITYIISDIDDAIKKGIINESIFNSEIKRVSKDCTEIFDFISDYNKYYIENKNERIDFASAINHLLYNLKKKIIFEVASSFVNNYERIIVKGIKYSFSDDDNNEILRFSDVPSGKVLFWLRDVFIRKYVFNNHEVISSELKGGNILLTLLNDFTQSILNLDIRGNDKIEDIINRNKMLTDELKYFNLISHNYVEVFLNSIREANIKLIIYYKLKLVVDFVCGMTDSYALNFYRSIYK